MDIESVEVMKRLFVEFVDGFIGEHFSGIEPVDCEVNPVESVLAWSKEDPHLLVCWPVVFWCL